MTLCSTSPPPQGGGSTAAETLGAACPERLGGVSSHLWEWAWLVHGGYLRQQRCHRVAVVEVGASPHTSAPAPPSQSWPARGITAGAGGGGLVAREVDGVPMAQREEAPLAEARSGLTREPIGDGPRACRRPKAAAGGKSATTLRLPGGTTAASFSPSLTNVPIPLANRGAERQPHIERSLLLITYANDCCSIKQL